MLKLAGFNSTIYSFNKKTGVSFTPRAVQMCTADDGKLHSSIALHRTELLKSHSQELLLYSRNNILDSSKILHYFGEEFTIA